MFYKNNTKLENFYILVLSIVVLIQLYHNFSSFWLDEITTAFVINGSFKDTILRTFYYQGQSPLYYIILWVLNNIIPKNDIILRSVSNVAGVISIYLVYKLSKRHLGKEGGIISSLFLTTSPLFMSHITSARPYVLALPFFLFGIIQLEDWIKEKDNKKLIIVLLCSIFIFYTQYILISSISIYFLMLLIAKFKDKNLKLKPAIFYFLSLILTFFPCLPHFLYKGRTSKIYQFAAPPDLSSLYNTIMNPELSSMITLFLIMLIASKILKIKKIKDINTINLSFIFILISWAIIPFLLLYLLYIFFDLSIFLPRYAIWQKPAIAILGAALALRISKRNYLRPIYCMLVVLTLTIILPKSQHDNENWKKAVKYLNKNEPCSILVYSGLIESQKIDWLYERKEYFIFPYLYYNKKRTNIDKIYPVPIFLETKEQKEYLNKILNKVKNDNKICLLTRHLHIRDSKNNTQTSSQLQNKYITKNIGIKPMKIKNFPSVTVLIWELNNK